MVKHNRVQVVIEEEEKTDQHQSWLFSRARKSKSGLSLIPHYTLVLCLVTLLLVGQRSGGNLLLNCFFSARNSSLVSNDIISP